jgi:hypothetical protein
MEKHFTNGSGPEVLVMYRERTNIKTLEIRTRHSRQRSLSAAVPGRK